METDTSTPDWQAREAQEALDEQRRHPRPYPSTKKEKLENEYDRGDKYDKLHNPIDEE